MNDAVAESFKINPIARRGTKVDIRVGAKNLVGLHAIAPNARAAVFIRNGSEEWKLVLESETKENQPNPVFSKLFPVEYRFELYQEVRVCIFDVVSPGDSLRKQHLIGVTDTALGNIISAQGDALERTLHKDGQATSCFVSISADEVMDSEKEVVLDIFLKDLMTPAEKTEQDAYLAQLHQQLHIPSAAPAVQRRPIASVMSKFRREEKVPAIRPAEIENVLHQESQHREAVQQEIEKVHAPPPPFVPYLEILTCPPEALAEHRDWDSPDIPWTQVYRSDDMTQYTDLQAGIPLETIRLPQTTLTGGSTNDDQWLKITVKRTRGQGAPIEVGYHITSVAALHQTCHPGEPAFFPMTPTGRFAVTRFEEIGKPSFLEILKKSNFDMSLIVGIDFTQSNGQPDAPDSLHHLAAEGVESGPNPYEAAIKSVANLLSAYSSDPRIAAYGFGAKIPPNWEVSHCFNVTGDPLGLCDNVHNLLDHYKNVLHRIQLWGPTMFSELLGNVKNVVYQRASAAKNSSALAYTTALIITDGDISDMDKTREQLVQLSQYPCSVIIIGVGSESFAKVRTLDDSGQPLKWGRHVACRRFVQFVDYRSFAGEGGQVDLSRLSESVLGNIPDHIVAYREAVGDSK